MDQPESNKTEQNRQPAETSKFEPPVEKYTVASQPVQRKISLQIVIPVILAIIILGFSATSLLAYGIVPSSPSIQHALADVLMKIPFFPKTPRYVLKSSVQAHENIRKVTIDASLAASLGDSGGMLGLGNIDAEIKGPIDYTDPTKPIFSVNAKISKDFDSDIRSKDQIVYFRVNALPSYLSIFMTQMGISDEIQKQILKKWFFVDTKPLDTEARRTLSEDAKKKATMQEAIDNYLGAFDDPAVLKSLSMSSDTLDHTSVYHLHFKPSDKVLEIFWQKYTKQQNTKSYGTSTYKISDSIKHFTVDTWIDKKEYLIRKSAVNFSFNQNSSSYSSSSLNTFGVLPTKNKELPVSFVITFSKFNENVPLEVPKNAIKFDEFMKTAFAASATQSAPLGSTKYQFSQSNNTKRMSDVSAILNAVNQYMADNKGKMPFGIATVKKSISSKGANICSALVPTYIAALPVDPAKNTGPIFQSNCTKVYDTGYTIQKVGLKLVVSAPLAELNQVISVSR